MTAGSLAHARTCYAHLAGWLGVQIAEELERRGLLRFSGPKLYRLLVRTNLVPITGHRTPGRHPRTQQACSPLSRLDRSRHHLAGPLGCSMYKRLVELRWVVPIRGIAPSGFVRRQEPALGIAGLPIG